MMALDDEEDEVPDAGKQARAGQAGGVAALLAASWPSAIPASLASGSPGCSPAPRCAAGAAPARRGIHAAKRRLPDAPRSGGAVAWRVRRARVERRGGRVVARPCPVGGARRRPH